VRQPSAWLRGLRVVHPFPSTLNALLVLALALIAGGSAQVASVLALAMLGLQFAIGAVNDLFDEELDRQTKPSKPIPSGLISRRATTLISLGAGSLALLMSAALGVQTLAMAAVMLGAGLAYDVWLKRTAWAWLAFSVAFPILPLYAWYGATGTVPPLYDLLLPLAVLAGPALQLSNGLVDLERDLAAGVTTLAGRLGRRRSLAVIGVLVGVIHAGAWATLVLGGLLTAWVVTPLVLSGSLAVVGLYLSADAKPARRERGWQAQACAVALLAVSWLAAALGA
jgi:4-hydroxybenzoate polyprenyltransferase